MRARRSLRPAYALTLAAAAGALCACGGGGGSHASPTPTGTTASPPSPAPSLSPPSPAPTGSTPRGTPGAVGGGSGRCRTDGLEVRISTAGPAAGQRFAFLTLTNTSGSACHVRGYVGMLLLTASDHPIPTNLERLSPPGPQTVVLRPGGSAHARLQWTIVPGAGEPAHGACAPTPGLAWITPPDERAHLVVAWNQGVVCGGGHVSTTPLSPGPAPG
ncbi:hypothetical protein GCM10009527_064360 [Actinomadura nitritigenes]|uniref:DUF4232 domain-containing protein n=1 Tax=Actinomadura nitritigenes TaxID=134602 RepID=A0ABS3RD24_9ACTN|nr:DUF4232 domain-containing protein [Actinomadura nitritigenes]MBO2444135.1 DUF4232 domain-containing protein [Actinomadura nitritigenes]